MILSHLSRHMYRFPRPALALAAITLGTLLGSTTLHAAPQVVVDAEDLDLSLPCIGRVEINVDPAMSDGVSLDSAATGGAHVTIRTGKTQGSSRVLIASKSCAPTAKVSILVAPNVGVLIHDSHDTHIVINGTLASLEASLEAGQLDADTIQSLDLSLRGTEQVHIAHLNRAAQVVAGGASGLVIDHANLDAFSAQLSESSHLSVTDGHFDVLTLLVNNAASVQIAGTANTATVTANGTGPVIIPHVNGALAQTGTIQVGPQTLPPPAPAPSIPVTPVPVPSVPSTPARAVLASPQGQMTDSSTQPATGATLPQTQMATPAPRTIAPQVETPQTPSSTPRDSAPSSPSRTQSSSGSADLSPPSQPSSVKTAGNSQRTGVSMPVTSPAPAQPAERTPGDEPKTAGTPPGTKGEKTQ